MKNKYYYNVCIGFNPDYADMKTFNSEKKAKHYISEFGSAKQYYTIRKSLISYTSENERYGHYPFQLSFEDGYVGNCYPHSTYHRLKPFDKEEYHYGVK